jgi:membrane-bound hydrogenase subunit alpha
MKRTVIPIGPYHPLQEEPEFFRLTVDGEEVVEVDVRLGFNHRGIEKLSEEGTFDQGLFLVERICGICSTSHPYAYARALEDVGQAEVPERARYIRTIVAEGERIHSHLLWLGLAGHFLGYDTVYMWVWKLREEILDCMEILTGNRNNYAMFRAGGVRRDIRPEDVPLVLGKLESILPTLDRLKKAILDDPVLQARLKGIGILSREDAVAYCAVGPTARASGISRDLRRNCPYGAYDRVGWEVVVTEEGDVFDKLVVRVLELFESARIMKACLEDLPGGEIDAALTGIPAGEGIGHIEAPRGETFHYVRTDGTNRPVRHKVRAPTYMNLPTCRSTVKGSTLADATIILASIDPCYCCTERMAVADCGGRRLMGGKELIRLSREKTAKLRERKAIRV